MFSQNSWGKPQDSDWVSSPSFGPSSSELISPIESTTTEQKLANHNLTVHAHKSSVCVSDEPSPVTIHMGPSRRSLKLSLLELGYPKANIVLPFQPQTTLRELRRAVLSELQKKFPEKFHDVQPETLIFKERYGFKRTAYQEEVVPIGEFFRDPAQSLELMVQLARPAVNTGKDISVFVGTWNMGNSPPPEDLSNWIPLSQDVYAIGVQESKYPGSDRWGEVLETHLGEEYYLVAKAVLMNIVLHVFARLVLQPCIGDVSQTSRATGIGNVLGNKGGVCVYFKLNDTRLCFVNCHLAAHQDKKDRRNQDVESIMRGLHLPGHLDLCNTPDYMFWMGDLNYRVNFSEYLFAVDTRTPTREAFEDVLRLIHGGMHLLLEKDQLTTERLGNRIFYGFEEQDIHFKPTFKVRPGVPLEYNAQRLPAWCDRILWKTAPNKTLQPPHMYKSDETITTSDHKPVMALFLLPPSIAPSPVDSALGPCTLRLLELRGRDLLAVPRAFSYIKFTGDMLENQLIYSTAVQGTHPVWQELPRLELLWNNPARLREEHLDLRFTDEGSRKPIGYARVPLSGIPLDMEVGAVSLPFECPVSFGGLPAGFIRGTLEFELKPRVVPPKPGVASRHSLSLKIDPQLLQRISDNFLDPGETVQFYCNNSKRPRVMVTDEAFHFVLLTDKRILCVNHGRVELDKAFSAIVRAQGTVRQGLFVQRRLSIIDAAGTVSSVSIHNASLLDFLLQRLNGDVTLRSEGSSMLEDMSSSSSSDEAEHGDNEETPPPRVRSAVPPRKTKSSTVAPAEPAGALQVTDDVDLTDVPVRPRITTLPWDERLWADVGVSRGETQPEPVDPLAEFDIAAIATRARRRNSDQPPPVLPPKPVLRQGFHKLEQD